ncbi:16S rRNA (cytosine(967)-C(5))-methyltransferase RsmB [Anaerovorax odorimutans]|uniref:16S rRNA (cytosine(967)-C(5))-methyltransferase n=1 Tax=Anaerovorax odorimutans TaxID=109327 RepID=A0ABT1RJG0_9FIRM|nr:16S rRNA (cytosine(967)-C(5))-methyltransferase RsmB [Anaerovorax odorimutans]MCQ4635299.1 16S rRNA (cytosine(967)-C(5))-methyltransferase RsmB [Anaerovorax odorimutans]
MDANRKTAYLTLMDVESKKSYSNIALNHQIICNRPNSQGFVRELVYGVLENKLLLDYYIDQLVSSGADSLRASDLTVLRMGIYQLGYMDSVPEYAAVNESVILAKRYCRGREGFVNGVLRNYLNRKFSIKLPDRTEDEIRYLSIKYSYAPWIIELWMEQYKVDFVEELLKAGNETPQTTIRLNWLRIIKKDLIEKLEAKGYEITPGELCQNALHVKGSELLGTELYKHGLFSIQDESSMLVAEKLDPKHGDVVMDVCAAPGGKTMAIAERMNNTGTIIASDIYRRKLDIIDKEAERLGITNVETRSWDATRVDSSMVEKADRVLVDVPCSGLGVVRRKPEIKYKEKTTEMELLPKKQLAILSASSQYVKPGGTLLYSTCTINPYENQRIIADFLKKNPSFKKEEAIQLLPHINHTDGFFICVMKKSKGLV